MNKFLKNTKELYLACVILIVILFGLLSVSFSYFFDSSSDVSSLIYKESIELSIDGKHNNELSILPYETKIVPIKIKNKSDYALKYKLYYEGSNESLDVSKESIKDSIALGETINSYIKIKNTSGINQIILLGIVGGNDNKTLKITGTEIQKEVSE